MIHNVEGQAVLVLTETFDAQSEISSTHQDQEMEDNFGCNGPFVKNFPSGEPWIAVIQRGRCTFSQKIANALKLNASGVVIYDNENSALLQSMKVELFEIPSVFTFQWKGRELVQLIQTFGKVFIRLTKGSHCRTIPFVKEDEQEMNPTEPTVDKTNREIVLYCGTLDTWAEFYDYIKKQAILRNWNMSKSFKEESAIGEKKFSMIVPIFAFVLMAVSWILFFFIGQRHRKSKMVRTVPRLVCRFALELLERRKIREIQFLNTESSEI
jgi:hypothetical protein